MLCNIFDDVNAAVVAPVFVQNRDTRINSLVMSSIAHGLGELLHYIFSIYFIFGYKKIMYFLYLQMEVIPYILHHKGKNSE